MSALAIGVYLAVGSLAGFLAGLLGIGGGIVIVAALVFVLPGVGVPAGQVLHVALATSLASIIATAIASSIAHHRRDAILWRSLKRLVPGLVIGGLLGAWIAERIDEDVLRIGFAVFCAVIAWQLVSGRTPPDSGPGAEPAGADLPFWGILIGAVSALVGIGGGSMTVPLLIHKGARAVRAIGTSSAAGVAIAIASAVGFGWVGHDQPALPSGTIGYIYAPAALGIAATSVLAAPHGAKVAHRVSGVLLKRVFAGFLVAVGSAVVIAGW